MIKGHTEICNELKNFFAAIVNQSKPPEPSLDTPMLPYDESVPETNIEPNHETNMEPNIGSNTDNERIQPELTLTLTVSDAPNEGNDNNSREQKQPDVVILDSPEVRREPDTGSNSQERKRTVLKFKMKPSSASSRAEEADNVVVLERSQGAHNGGDHGTSSSVSMDAQPPRNLINTANVSNQNLEDVNSCHDLGSRVTASIGSAKLAAGDAALLTELQCTADSSKVQVQSNDVDPVNHMKYISLQALNGTDDMSLAGPTEKPISSAKEKEKKKKDKEKKRKKSHKDKDDPEYLERKRLKKEKKKKEKELAKLKVKPSITLKLEKKPDTIKEVAEVAQVNNVAALVDDVVMRTEGTTTASTSKIKIKIKNRLLTGP